MSINGKHMDLHHLEPLAPNHKPKASSVASRFVDERLGQHAKRIAYQKAVNDWEECLEWAFRFDVYEHIAFDLLPKGKPLDADTFAAIERANVVTSQVMAKVHNRLVSLREAAA